MTRYLTMDTPLTDDEREAWLTKIREKPELGNKTALLKVGVKATLKQITGLLEDPEFAEAYETARGRHPERVRAEIMRRAIDGVEEQVYNKDGDIVGTRVTYSDRLLALAAKAILPEYRDARDLTITGPNDGPLEVTHAHRLTLGDVIRYAGTLPGLGDSPGGQLPAAPELVAEPEQGELAAGDIPPRQQP